MVSVLRSHVSQQANRYSNYGSHSIFYNYPLTWSMMGDHHPVARRQEGVAVEAHLASDVWQMIKADKRFTELNCPLTLRCLLEGDTLPSALSTGAPDCGRKKICLKKRKEKRNAFILHHCCVNQYLTCNILPFHLSHMLPCSCLTNAVDASPLISSAEKTLEHFQLW